MDKQEDLRLATPEELAELGELVARYEASEAARKWIENPRSAWLEAEGFVLTQDGDFYEVTKGE